MMLFAAVASLFVALDQAPTDERFGDWTYREVVDPITDARKGVAFVSTDEGNLVVKCDEPGSGSVYVSFQPNEFLGDGRSTTNRRPVLYRFDSDLPIEVRWLYGDRSALLTDNPSGFTRRIASAERVIIRAMTYRYVEVTRSFQISGGGPAIERVYATCGDTM